MKIYTRWCLFYLLFSSPSASSAFEWTNSSSPNGSYTFAFPEARWTPNKPYHRIVYYFIQLMGWCFYCVVTNESECIVSSHIHSCLWRRWAVERKPKWKYWKTTMYILLPEHTKPNQYHLYHHPYHTVTPLKNLKPLKFTISIITTNNHDSGWLESLAKESYFNEEKVREQWNGNEWQQ